MKGSALCGVDKPQYCSITILTHGPDHQLYFGNAAPRLALQGVATRTQLLQKWPDVRRLSSQLAYLPLGQTGFLQLGLASVAAKLKACAVEANLCLSCYRAKKWCMHN